MTTLPELLKTLVEMGGRTSTRRPTRRRRSACTGICSGCRSPILTPAETKQLAYSVLTDAQKKRFEETLELDFSFGIKGLARVPLQHLQPARGGRRRSTG